MSYNYNMVDENGQIDLHAAIENIKHALYRLLRNVPIGTLDQCDNSYGIQYPKDYDGQDDHNSLSLRGEISTLVETMFLLAKSAAKQELQETIINSYEEK